MSFPPIVARSDPAMARKRPSSGSSDGMAWYRDPVALVWLVTMGSPGAGPEGPGPTPAGAAYDTAAVTATKIANAFAQTVEDAELPTFPTSAGVARRRRLLKAGGGHARPGPLDDQLHGVPVLETEAVPEDDGGDDLEDVRVVRAEGHDHGAGALLERGGEALRPAERAPARLELPDGDPLGGAEELGPRGRRWVAGDQSLLEELEEPLRRRLLAHPEERAELLRGQGHRPRRTAFERDALQGLELRRLHRPGNRGGVDNLFEALEDQVVPRPQGDAGDGEAPELEEEPRVVRHDDRVVAAASTRSPSSTKPPGEGEPPLERRVPLEPRLSQQTYLSENLPPQLRVTHVSPLASRVLIVLLAGVLLAPVLAAPEVPDGAPSPMEVPAAVRTPSEVAALSGFFTENAGQVGNPEILYYARGGEVYVGFAAGAVLLNLRERPPHDELDPRLESAPPAPAAPLRGHLVRTTFEGANPVLPQGRGELPHRANFFLGDDPAHWHTNVRNFAEVIYENAWDGIDVVYRTSPGGAKYDLVVHPGADLADVAFAYEGVTDLAVTPHGLAAGTSLGPLRDDLPAAWQASGLPVDCALRQIGEHTVGYACSGWDGSGDLVIDPLLYPTFLGGSGSDGGLGIA